MKPSAKTLATTACVVLGLTVAVAARADRAAGREALLELHRQSLQAHLDGDWRWFGEHMGDDYVLAFEGKITRPSREETLAQFRHYFSSTEFETYEDVVEPLVEISDDGTLGTVLVRVRVVGVSNKGEENEVRHDATWVWVGVWRKVDGLWLLQANVSNHHEGPPQDD